MFPILSGSLPEYVPGPSHPTVITVVGYENGGATGTLDIGTLVMTPSVVDAVDVPVIAGGGVSDGRGIAAMKIARRPTGGDRCRGARTFRNKCGIYHTLLAPASV